MGTRHGVSGLFFLEQRPKQLLTQRLAGLGLSQPLEKSFGRDAICGGHHLDDVHEPRVGGREIEAATRGLEVRFDGFNVLAGVRDAVAEEDDAMDVLQFRHRLAAFGSSNGQPGNTPEENGGSDNELTKAFVLHDSEK